MTLHLSRPLQALCTCPDHFCARFIPILVVGGGVKSILVVGGGAKSILVVTSAACGNQLSVLCAVPARPGRGGITQHHQLTFRGEVAELAHCLGVPCERHWRPSQPRWDAPPSQQEVMGDTAVGALPGNESLIETSPLLRATTRMFCRISFGQRAQGCAAQRPELGLVAALASYGSVSSHTRTSWPCRTGSARSLRCSR